MKYNYYPGCSLERNAHAYHDSAMEVALQLGIEFVEVDDWNCCGATEKIAVEKLAAYSLVSRNLAIIADQKENGVLVAPCSLCLLNLKKVDKHMQESDQLSEDINEALTAGGISYQPGDLEAMHLLDVFTKDVEADLIKAKIKKPLYGLRVASYYGCLITRPNFNGKENDDFPTQMDDLMGLLGAEIVDYTSKTKCCGGHMTQISEPTALELMRHLLKNAEDEQTDIIATLCPMCQFNMDAYQDKVNKYFGTSFNIPILYFTQLIGVAFGIENEKLGIGLEFVSAEDKLANIKIEPLKAPKKKRASKFVLPMPKVIEEV